jgi:hypothetical protein
MTTPPQPSTRRLNGRERFWRSIELYLEFWAIAREPEPTWR